MARYDGKRAVVIGGTSGMGLATARLLRDEGVSVLVTGRTEEGVESARRQLGDQVDVVVSDTTSLVDIAALGEHVEERLDVASMEVGDSRGAVDRRQALQCGVRSMVVVPVQEAG